MSRAAKGADCKSAGLRLRRFESYFPHHLINQRGRSHSSRSWWALSPSRMLQIFPSCCDASDWPPVSLRNMDRQATGVHHRVNFASHVPSRAPLVGTIGEVPGYLDFPKLFARGTWPGIRKIQPPSQASGSPVAAKWARVFVLLTGRKRRLALVKLGRLPCVPRLA